jgi:hypothetical protein
MSEWQEQDDALVREFELPSFPAAIEFVDRLAELAESEDHHPDIDNRTLVDPLGRRDHRERSRDGGANVRPFRGVARLHHGRT